MPCTASELCARGGSHHRAMRVRVVCVSVCVRVRVYLWVVFGFACSMLRAAIGPVCVSVCACVFLCVVCKGLHALSMQSLTHQHQLTVSLPCVQCVYQTHFYK